MKAAALVNGSRGSVFAKTIKEVREIEASVMQLSGKQIEAKASNTGGYNVRINIYQ